ncbi:Na+-dependent transporters of the SNF family [gut metagenome]|uniref:Na+-dependent transporters of the SNF family n=1 Tax=gut metagenome TaxID=749906 RepID=J9GKR1_9ZZZZ
MDLFHASRRVVSLVITVISAVSAVIICMGYNIFYFEVLLPNGATAQLLDLVDYASNSFLMPLISFFTCIFVGWIIKPRWIEEEMEVNNATFTRKKLFAFMIRWPAPIIMAILFLQSTGLFTHLLNSIAKLLA